MRLSLTAAGRGVLALGLACYALGWLLGQGQMLVVGAVLLVALGVALAWVAVPSRVEVDRRVAPVRVTVEQPAYGIVEVRNIGRYRTPRLIAEETIAGETTRGAIPSLPPGGIDTGQYRLPTHRRGVYTVGPLRVLRSDPFRFVVRSGEYGRVERLYVHPRAHPIDPGATGRRRDLEGPTRDTSPEGGVTFHAIRPYQVCDDLRAIHWRSTAKTGSLMVRQYVDTSQSRTTILLDDRSRAHTHDSFEVAVEVATSLVAASVERNYAVELRVLDASVIRGDVALPGAAFLDALAALQPTASGDLSDAMNRLATGPGSDALVVVTTPSVDAVDLRAVARLSGAFATVTIVNVRPELGTIVPPSSRIEVLDTPSGEVFARRWQGAVAA
jgi:uncharacterized protein (DUF58 family)